MKEGPLKEPLAVTARATQLEQISKERSQEENSGGNSQRRKRDFEEVPWWGQILKGEGKGWGVEPKQKPTTKNQP